MVVLSKERPLLATERKLSLSFDLVVSALTGFNFNSNMLQYSYFYILLSPLHKRLDFNGIHQSLNKPHIVEIKCVQVTLT